MSLSVPMPLTVHFPLTVDQDLSLTAQTLLRRECGDLIRTITQESVPHQNETRLWITLAATAFSKALHAVLLGIPAAEFGPLKVARMEPIALLSKEDA